MIKLRRKLIHIIVSSLKSECLRSTCSESCSKTCENLQNLNNSNEELSEQEIKRYPYYFEDGLRKVYPYYYQHTTFCKGRWVNQKVIDVYCKEFSIYPEGVYKERIRKGYLKVNGNVINTDYVLKNSDLLTSIVHRHELPVLDCPIKILYEDDTFFVIDKPPSIPVHPCGLYHENTIINILSNDFKKNNLHATHRLDRLTSGILVFVKSKEKAREFYHDMILRNVEKEYICRVEGNFPDNIIVCNKPIKQFYSKVGVCLVHSKGKESITEFTKLSYNGTSSVLLCKPITGRTHQIRVHLQYLGYPIINDPIYNSFLFGNMKGRGGILEKSVDELLDKMRLEYSSQWCLNQNYPKETSLHKNLCFSLFKNNYIIENNVSHKKDFSHFTYDSNCYFCNLPNRDPEQDSLGIFLHAYKYKGPSWEFKSDIPFWAVSDWTLN